MCTWIDFEALPANSCDMGSSLPVRGEAVEGADVAAADELNDFVGVERAAACLTGLFFWEGEATIRTKRLIDDSTGLLTGWLVGGWAGR